MVRGQLDTRFLRERSGFTETTCDKCGEVVLPSEKRFIFLKDGGGIECHACRGKNRKPMRNVPVHHPDRCPFCGNPVTARVSTIFDHTSEAEIEFVAVKVETVCRPCGIVTGRRASYVVGN